MKIDNVSLTAHTCDNTQKCGIPVTVVNCVVSIPDDLKDVVIKKNYVTILWELTQPSIQSGYRFDHAAGVALKASTPDNGHWYTGKQFSGQGPILDDTGYLWVDRNSDWDAYLYTINIVDKPNNRACPPLDPRVVNN